jgi:hypothetical protein
MTRFELNILTVFLYAVFDPVLDIEQIGGVSWVVRSDWHDHLLAAGVVPVETIVQPKP